MNWFTKIFYKPVAPIKPQREIVKPLMPTKPLAKKIVQAPKKILAPIVKKTTPAPIKPKPIVEKPILSPVVSHKISQSSSTSIHTKSETPIGRFKFRVWDKQNRKFLYPDGLSANYGSENYIIQEWTGYRDVNNKRIYEGDIVNVMIDFMEEKQSSKEDIYECQNALIQWINGQFYLEKAAAPMNFFQNFQVIGNNIQNPKLIEE